MLVGSLLRSCIGIRIGIEPMLQPILTTESLDQVRLLGILMLQPILVEAWPYPP